MSNKVLILHDNQPYANRLINMGDSALTEGFYNILRQHGNLEIISAGRKNFPYFNIKKIRAFSSKVELENIFNGLILKLIKKNKKGIVLEQKLFNSIYNNPAFNNSIFQELNRRFSEKYSKNISETITPFIFRNLSFAKQMEKIQQSDFVLCNTGGLIADHLDFYLPSYLFECFLAKKLGKPTISLNQSIAVNKPLNRAMVSLIYGMLDFHMTREPISTNKLIDMGIDKNRIITSCDTAFATDYNVDKITIEKLVKRNRLKDGGIGIAIRGDRNVNYPKVIDTIKLLKRKFKKRVYFIATCKAHDMCVYNKLSKVCNILYLDDLNDYRVLTNLIKFLDIVITDRYHAAIFTIIARTPLIALHSQTIKIEGLFKLFQYPIKTFKFEDLAPKEIIGNVELALNQKNRIKGILANTHKQLRNKVINDINSILSSMETQKFNN